MKKIIYGYFYEDEELCLVHAHDTEAEIKYFNNKQALVIDGEKIFINHRKTVEIPTCPRCDSENVHIWKRGSKKNGTNDGFFTYFHFKCKDCGLKRSVRSDSVYFKKLIDTPKELQTAYVIRSLEKEGNAYVSSWIIYLFDGKDNLGAYLSNELKAPVIFKEPQDPEMLKDGDLIAEVKYETSRR